MTGAERTTPSNQEAKEMPKLEEKLAAAEAKVKQLKVRQRQIEARKRSLATRNERGKDLRRKILVGAIVLERVAAGEIPKQDLHRWIDSRLTRPDDRALFDLPVKDAG
jgi:hypothetical protein